MSAKLDPTQKSAFSAIRTGYTNFWMQAQARSAQPWVPLPSVGCLASVTLLRCVARRYVTRIYALFFEDARRGCLLLGTV